MSAPFTLSSVKPPRPGRLVVLGFDDELSAFALRELPCQLEEDSVIEIGDAGRCKILQSTMAVENDVLLRNLLDGALSRLHSNTVTPTKPKTMKPPRPLIRRFARVAAPALLALLLAAPTHAHASMFQGETLDAVANGIAWFALILVPIVGVTVFLMVHILPEKIAEKKKHPQTAAIQCLCLLSLVFGGLLWPIAWLWAYTKPVAHKIAYGTDVDESHGNHKAEGDEATEVEKLRARIAILEAQLNKGGKL